MEWIQIIKDLVEIVVLACTAAELIRKVLKRSRKKNKKKKRK